MTDRKPSASRAADRRLLIYLSDPSTREQLDALAAEDGITRSQMIARLVEREAQERQAGSNRRA